MAQLIALYQMWVERYGPLEQVLVGGGGGLASSSYTSHNLHNTEYLSAHVMLQPHNRTTLFVPSRNLPTVSHILTSHSTVKLPIIVAASVECYTP